MSDDIEAKLCSYLQNTKFAIQFDESTLPDNTSLLLAYVRFIKDKKMYEELLFTKNLETDTKGETIYGVMKEYFSKNSIPLSNIMSAAADGAPAMFGRYRGFMIFLKRDVPGVFTIHCVIHRQHLVARHLSPRLHESFQSVIHAVNKIRANSLNTRLFNQLCEDNDEIFRRLLLHTEVRWLSKGMCLTRFLALFDSVVEFQFQQF